MNIKTLIASVFKGLAIMLVLVVLLPSAIKLTHIFNHHTHQVCDADGNSKTHFHESDIDCDFYKFKISKIQFLVLSKYIIKPNFLFSKEKLEHYISYNNYQQLTRYLRGPPQLM